MRPIIGLTTSSYPPDAASSSERYGVTGLYAKAVATAGGAPLLIPGLGDIEAVRAVFPHLDGLLFTGGPDVHPARYGQEIHPHCEAIDEGRDATELELLRLVREMHLPAFGICRGCQMINVAFGGTLLQDIPFERPGSLDHRGSVPEPARPVHDLRVEPGTQLAGILGTLSIPANSLHHQALDAIAPGFRVNAWAADGTVEGIERTEGAFLLAVQCHPEHLFLQDARWQQLFEAFVQATARQEVRI